MKTATNGGPPGSFADKFRLIYAAACDSRLSKGGVSVLAVLAWRFNANHGCCWPSMDSIASDAGVDKRTVQRNLDDLEDFGYLHVRRDKGALNKFVLHFGAGSDPGHPRPKPPAPMSLPPGIHVSQPPAPVPPESINGFLKEKKAFESNSGKAFSLGGNGEVPGKERLPYENRPTEPKPKASPEEKRRIRLSILDTQRDSFGIQEEDYDEKLDRIEALYLADKQAEAEG